MICKHNAKRCVGRAMRFIRQNRRGEVRTEAQQYPRKILKNAYKPLVISIIMCYNYNKEKLNLKGSTKNKV